LTIGQTATDDKAKVCYDVFLLDSSFRQTVSNQAIIKTAFENGINMFDVAEGYASGQSEIEL
jgi:aryl-alcohol dehydrogenase-like predicted oxidoreductase